ncbi:MAG: hypothetical protein CMO80_06185 [Verrucomicrobiales bacterium]|nr:hypothetical protein [Verrucomicrobiales bacterium]|tara:strand:+ start:672 stop:1484 length:813 start_codon:yes stop_codon:yes gene_type:complete
MALAKVEFVTRKRGASLEDFEWEVEFYLSGLQSNGQIERDYLIEYKGRRIVAICQLAKLKFSLPRHCSAFGKTRLKKLLTDFETVPEWSLIETGRCNDVDWRKAPFLFLNTSVFQTVSPVTVPGPNLMTIATVILPINELTRERVKCWAREYQDLQAVWMNSGHLEGRAYKEIADPNSEFSEQGRDLARTLEKELKKPFYYFLPRSHGRRDESGRVCPGCGRKWRIKAAEAEKLGDYITFKCASCRLVSEDASSRDPRFAKYGEYRPKKS